MEKYYKFDRDKLDYQYVSKYQLIKDHIVHILVFSSLIVGVLFFTLSKGIVRKYIQTDRYVQTEGEVVIINHNQNEFTQEKLTKEIDRLNFRFPHIVLSQTILETGHYTSDIFKENNNLFGMREPRIRVNTVRGTHSGHGFYDNWMESLYDYGFYNSRYLGKLKTEEEYFKYLSKHYATDVTYVSKLKSIIKKEGLKEKFN
jgi:uncharacterized FlgJ-related protein|tara:strand:- start:3091 stop:3693 length:603 start_codon:yes stop_codon:yes gene_type:complete